MLNRFVLGPILFTVGVALIVAAVFIFVETIERISMAKESRGWPSVPGLITASEITSNTSIGAYGSATTTSYHTKVSYGYRVQGHDYESGRVTFGSVGSSYERAKEVANRYPLGMDVAVFYDPANPAQSVLEPGKEPPLINRLGPGVFALAGILFGGIGLVLVMSSRD